MSTIKKIVKNSIFGVVSEAISGVLLFVAFLLAARYLGAARFGVFSYILALVGVFQLIADFGLTNIVVREIAKTPDNASRVMGAIKPLAWLFSLLTLAIIILIGFLFAKSNSELWATSFMGVAVLATYHSVLYGSVCRAFEEMGYNAAGNVSHKILLLALIVAVTQADLGLVGLASAYMVANWAQWMFFHLIVRTRYFRVKWQADWRYCTYLLREAFPVGAAMVLRRLTLHLDTLLLTVFSTSIAAGLFNAAYKIVQMMDMIPFTLSIPLFPPLSRLAEESHNKMFAALNHALRIFFLMAIPLACWLWLCAPFVLSWTFGADYADAVHILKILALAVVFLFPTSLFIYAFSAAGQQKLYTLSAAICLVTNAIFDLALIPAYGATGAAIATLSAEIMFFLGGAFLLRRLGARVPYLELFGKPLAATALAAVILAWGIQDQNIVTVAAFTMVYWAVYLMIVVVLRALHRDEIVLLVNAIRVRDKSVALPEAGVKR